MVSKGGKVGSTVGITLRVPAELHRACAMTARRHGMSLEELVIKSLRNTTALLANDPDAELSDARYEAEIERLLQLSRDVQAGKR
jgi:hypothetical protein